MLKFESDPNGDHIEIEGTLSEITADVVSVIRSVYTALLEIDNGERSAEVFKNAILGKAGQAAFMTDDELHEATVDLADELFDELKELKELKDRLADQLTNQVLNSLDSENSVNIETADFTADREFDRWFHDEYDDDDDDDDDDNEWFD